DLEVAAQLAAPSALQDQAQRLTLRRRDRREAHVDDVHADVREGSCQLVLDRRREGDAGHLLAVPEGVVIDADPLRGWKREVVLEAGGRPDKLVERLLEVDGGRRHDAQTVERVIARSPMTPAARSTASTGEAK